MAAVAPQFEVIVPSEALSYGTKVLVNGVELRNVSLVEVTNRAAFDDLVTSRITIELSGEAIAVERTGGESKSLESPQADTGGPHKNYKS